ncbi:MAG: rod shape-determining protein RodA [Thermoanaerobacterales bacterium]|nr:rod shape-determining protein RodA [Bacillota bacterium]MDI6906470.1 rod shape-determining protein RodA [Thermoanaerobacterales bacterium]
MLGSRRFIKNLDYTLLLVAAVLVALSLVAVSSATHAPGGPQNLHLVRMQAVWILLGSVALVTMLLFNYEDLARYHRLLYIVNLVFLTAVLIAGRESLGAQRWIQLGPFSFQPSEFAKLIIIITLANFLAHREGELKTLRDLLPVFAYVGVPILLIMKQPDLGTSLVFLAITWGMLFMAGANPRLLAGLGLGGVTAAVGWVWAHLSYGIWIPLKDYQINRLTIFLNPWVDPHRDGYNVIQSQIAIGSGGLWGKGLYQGTQSQYNFLPIQHTDFIFSVLAEELGLIGGILLLTLYFVLLYRGARIAAQARDTFGTLLAAGIVSMLVFHILVNIGMNAGIMPVTGIPLPLISYGGSAMIMNLAALGILLSIWVRRQKIVF